MFNDWWKDFDVLGLEKLKKQWSDFWKRHFDNFK